MILICIDDVSIFSVHDIFGMISIDYVCVYFDTFMYRI